MRADSHASPDQPASQPGEIAVTGKDWQVADDLPDMSTGEGKVEIFTSKEFRSKSLQSNFLWSFWTEKNH